MQEKKIKYMGFILLQSLVYGIGNPLTKVAYESISPLWLLSCRFVLGFAVFAALFGKRTLQQLKGVRWTLWMPSALCCAGAYISCNFALDMTSATNVGFIMSLSVLFTPILSAVVLHRRYERSRLPLQLLMVLGLYLLCCNGGGFSFGLGEGIALFDALCIAGTLAFSEDVLKKLDGAAVSTLQAGVTMVLSLLGAALLEDISALRGVQTEAWLVVAYLALVCTVLAYLLQNIAVARLSAATVAMLQCTQPVLTAAVAFFVLRESLSGLGLAGGAVILLCLLADSWLQNRRALSAET